MLATFIIFFQQAQITLQVIFRPSPFKKGFGTNVRKM